MADNEKFMDDAEIYLAEVEQIPQLGAQEFHTLLLRAADGDEEAQLDLVNANLRPVVKIARKYVGLGVAFSDLIQEGNLGLLEAVRKFTTKGATTFIDYAEEQIEKAIVRALNEMNGAAQVSLDTPIDAQTYSDSEKFSDADDFVEGLTLADLMEDRDTPTHFERLKNRQLNELLDEALETLTPHEKKVLSLRFGLEDGRTRTHDEVGKLFSADGMAIKLVEMNALGKLRQINRVATLREFC